MEQVWLSIGKFLKSIGHDRVKESLRKGDNDDQIKRDQQYTSRFDAVRKFSFSFTDRYTASGSQVNDNRFQHCCRIHTLF